jgi:hypothetical protein
VKMAEREWPEYVIKNRYCEFVKTVLAPMPDYHKLACPISW